MATAQKTGRFKRYGILFGLGVLVFALALPLLALIPRGGQLPSPNDLEAHQEIVSEVMLSKDRVELIGDSPTRGNPNAQLILLKFSDFQCPFCGQAAGNMKTFMNDSEADVLYVYKHFPLTQIHPEAIPSARASWAAQQQDQFWPYHDALFAKQDRLGDDLYTEIAQTLGLNMEQFESDRTSAASRDAVEQDQQLTRELRLSSTPTFVLNDLLVPGSTPMEFFETVVEQQRGA
jgi:protein-disulfide isomerase